MNLHCGTLTLLLFLLLGASTVQAAPDSAAKATPREQAPSEESAADSEVEAAEENGKADAARAREDGVDDAYADDAYADDASAEAATADEANQDEALADDASAEAATADEANQDEALADDASAEATTADEANQDEALADDASAVATTADESVACVDPEQIWKDAYDAALADFRDEAARQQAESEERPFIGVYFGARLGGVFGLASTHQWSEDCPTFRVAGESWDPTCTSQAPLGAAVDVHLGFRWGFVGVEVYGMGAADWSNATLEGAPPIDLPDYATEHQIGRGGAGGGGAVRLMHSLGPLDLNAALGAGFMSRWIFTNVSSLDGSSERYVAPVIRFDAGVVFFHTLSLGLLSWVEFTPVQQVRPDLQALSGVLGGSETTELAERFVGTPIIFDGPEFFLGPYLGLAFGERP